MYHLFVYGMVSKYPARAHVTPLARQQTLNRVYVVRLRRDFFFSLVFWGGAPDFYAVAEERCFVWYTGARKQTEQVQSSEGSAIGEDTQRRN